MVENCGLVDVSWETVASSRGGLKEGSQMVGHEMASLDNGNSVEVKWGSWGEKRGEKR